MSFQSNSPRQKNNINQIPTLIEIDGYTRRLFWNTAQPWLRNEQMLKYAHLDISDSIILNIKPVALEEFDKNMPKDELMLAQSPMRLSML